MIDDALLDILACPKCKAAVKEEGGWLVCQNAACALRYPVRNGVPVLLVDEAVKAAETPPTLTASG